MKRLAFRLILQITFNLFPCDQTLRSRRAIRGALGIFASPENFKTLYSNFDICRNFQRIKMKCYILIIFKKSLILIFLCPIGKLSAYKIYLETGHLIENFVNDWYSTTNMLELSKRGRYFKMLVFLSHFFVLLFVCHFFWDRPQFGLMKLYNIRVLMNRANC